MHGDGVGERPDGRVERRLDRAVAQAAEAWLTDPADAGVYARLVEAVLARRAALDARDPRMDDGSGALPVRLPGLAATAAGLTDPDDDVLAGRPPVEAVGAVLEGDARAVLERLRRG